MQKIACTYMRSGTSKGPFFDLRDLPADLKKRDEVLLRIMGSPDIHQIDGLGGATSLTSKIVMVQPSLRKGIDVDYLLAQVMIDQPAVDTKPTCGNMMSGVGPFAIEKGWVKADNPATTVVVYNINTDSIIEIMVLTPDGKVNYTDGDFAIDGVPGKGAPIVMNLFNIAGGTTGKLFPTGNQKDVIEGIEVSIVDAGNLMIQMKAADLGLNGSENAAYFKSHPGLLSRIEKIRLQSGLLAGIGDVTESVLPKVGLLSSPRNGGSIKSQYFTPHAFHPSHAVSGAISIATAAKAEGTITSEIAEVNGNNSERILVEHVSGILPIQITVSGKGKEFTVVSAGTLRTARKIMDGFVYY